MAPIRRYLRITKYSVLEVRIYLESASDRSWILSTPRGASASTLQTILEAVRPHVLPKLREENEHARQKTAGAGGGKGKKSKARAIKDVVVREDFDVTVFLTDLSTRHSLLTKKKRVRDLEGQSSVEERKGSNRGLTGWLNAGREKEDAIRILDENEEGDVPLREIPEAAAAAAADGRGEEDEALFVSSSDEDISRTQRERRAKRRRGGSRDEIATVDVGMGDRDEVATDDKKKLAMTTSYDGFSIYGRILCLVVTRKGKKAGASHSAPIGGSQMMEQWVSTQAAQDAGLDEDDEG